MLSKQKIHQALEHVLKTELVEVSEDDLVLLAIAIWHEGFVPDITWVKNLNPKEQQMVGYIAEFMSGFNVLCPEERGKLLKFTEKLKPPKYQSVNPKDNLDELALEWGLERDLTPYFEVIAPYQVRHYKHKSSYKRPSPNFIL